MDGRQNLMTPDLLQPAAALRIDFEHTKFAVSLAFDGAVAGGMFSEALDKAALPRSTWEPSGFANDLFVSRFVAQCLRVRIGGREATLSTRYLTRVLCQPPAEIAIVDYRREILAELAASSDARRAFEKLYLALCSLRSLLENAGAGRVWDANRRKLDILTALKQVFQLLAEQFSDCRSGLGCLGTFGAQVTASEPYQALSDLLNYDAHLASLSVRVAVGADGRIRGFEVLSVNENSDNPFVNPVWRRWLSKIELFLRGYRFGDGEVMARLLDSVFTGLEVELVALVQLLGDCEFYLGALGFRDQAEAAGLKVCLPKLVTAESPRDLRSLFNPLLLLNGSVPVPCDLIGDRLTSTTLVTGPNSGGKTRLLQALGLTQLLAQSGLFIPAREGSVALSSGLVASLIEQVQADQAEGRLGMELLRIRALFESLPPGAMVLLDELCSGTNPSEGEQIFELVLTMLNRLGLQVFITTHFLAFAARLAGSATIERLNFLQVELNADRQPTYQFKAGVAQTSLAGHTAERLGVTGDQLLRLVEASLSKQSRLTSEKA